MTSSAAGKRQKQQFIAARTAARKLALIGVYQWLITQNELSTIVSDFQLDSALSKDYQRADKAYLNDLLSS